MYNILHQLGVSRGHIIKVLWNLFHMHFFVWLESNVGCRTAAERSSSHVATAKHNPKVPMKVQVFPILYLQWRVQCSSYLNKYGSIYLVTNRRHMLHQYEAAAHLLLTMIANRSERAEENRNQRHDDQATVGYRHALWRRLRLFGNILFCGAIYKLSRIVNSCCQVVWNCTGIRHCDKKRKWRFWKSKEYILQLTKISKVYCEYIIIIIISLIRQLNAPGVY